ncbi:adenylate/guanylate cyclase domain-containing protein [Piscinibacter aquaticus]|uniref:Adenylate/guanylate cyclase domain-containing protein n=1 Tax=Piscinibacter aquaticus TaxID=392597 RepID=A0A5C6U5W5_9BURK|nr:adenylate/guanylate cyclase domain-containing protein [Piscinibacter aquaticus]
MSPRALRVLRWALLGFALTFTLLHASGIAPLRFLQQLDLAIDDARLRAALPGTKDPRIVIVDIDDASPARIGRWPWPRERIAALADELFGRQQAATVGFDLAFAEPEHGDEVLARALAGRPAVLGYIVSNGPAAQRTGVLPPPVIPPEALGADRPAVARWSGHAASVETLATAAPVAGFFNALPDVDGVVRSLPLLAEVDGALRESLALAMLRLHAGSPRVQPVLAGPVLAAIELEQGNDRLRIPLDARGAVKVPFRGAGGPAGGSFDYVSAADLIEGRLPAATLAGKLVLVGSSAPGVFDLRSTPVAAVYPGVEVHASVLSGLLDGRGPLAPDWSRGYEVAQLLAVTALLALLLPRLRPAAAAFATLGLAAALIAIDQWLYRRHGPALPLASALLLTALVYAGITGWGVVVEGARRRQLARLFGTYVPPELVAQMARDPQRYGMQAENRVLTIMFCDMRNFTRISEALPPEELRALINRFFSAMTEEIRAHRGTLDKYIGDAIMAFWGAPVADDDHALHAVQAALAMIGRLDGLNRELRERGLPEIGLGIGVNTGLVCVGDMGSDIRRSYTVMGDAVNLASRIEALTRIYEVDIVLGQATKEAVREALPLIEVDRVRVKGKQQAVTLFTPVSRVHANDSRFAEEVRLWNLALVHYRRQDAKQALTSLAALRDGFGSSALAGLYRQLGERIERWSLQPEPPEWDGTRTFDSK